MKPPLVCLLSAQAQQATKPAKADEAKAIAAGINAPVEKDPRVQSDGQAWGINKATVSDPTRPRVLLIGDSSCIISIALSDALRFGQYVDIGTSQMMVNPPIPTDPPVIDVVH